MSEHQPNTGVSWTKVVARGLNARVPAPIRKIDKEGNRESFTTRVLFETPAIAAYNRSKQVTSIIQTALSCKSVVFEFPSTTFNTRIEAYKLILDQIGPVVGNGFNPISLRGSRASGKLIISTEFRDTLHTAKAIQQGVTVENIQFKATPFKDTASSSSELIRVNLTLNVYHEVDIMTKKLINSFRHYGKVVQIKQLLHHNIFEGEISVLLDRSLTDIDTPAFQDLTRMLYLEDWDDFVPASFKGAQPVCYYCRKSGHIKTDCPTLTKMKCFICNQTGHTRRRCKASVPVIVEGTSTQSSFEDELDEYIRRTAAMSPPNLSDQFMDSEEKNQEKVDLKNIKLSDEEVRDETRDETRDENSLPSVAKTDINQLVKRKSLEKLSNVSDNKGDTMTEDITMFEEDVHEKDMYTFILGSSASKHAPNDIRSTMDVDPHPSTSSKKAKVNSMEVDLLNDDTVLTQSSKVTSSKFKSPKKSKYNTRQGHE